MQKLLIFLVSLSTVVSTCPTKKNSPENLKIQGVYYASSPREAEGNYYFFEDEQFHVFWRYDKESLENRYAARFAYYIEDDKIFACNKQLLCDKDGQFTVRYEIISNEMMGKNQVIKLKAKHFTTPLILEKRE